MWDSQKGMTFFIHFHTPFFSWEGRSRSSRRRKLGNTSLFSGTSGSSACCTPTQDQATSEMLYSHTIFFLVVGCIRQDSPNVVTCRNYCSWFLYIRRSRSACGALPISQLCTLSWSFTPRYFAERKGMIKRIKQLSPQSMELISFPTARYMLQINEFKSLCKEL